jgi:hypothetical protein
VHTTYENTFTFEDVPPGYYYVVFRGRGDGVPAVTEVTIESKEAVCGVQLVVDEMG